MNKTTFKLIAALKLHLIQKKVYCYTKNSKQTQDILNSLWFEKLIWGYTLQGDNVKIYLKYLNSKSLIRDIQTYNKNVTINLLKKWIHSYPQSIFILSTPQGLKSSTWCLTANIAGKLVLRIN